MSVNTESNASSKKQEPSFDQQIHAENGKEFL